MRTWGYIIALFCGLSAGWVAKQFWNASQDFETVSVKQQSRLQEQRLQKLAERAQSNTPVRNNEALVEDSAGKQSSAGEFDGLDVDTLLVMYRQEPERFLQTFDGVELIVAEWLAKGEFEQVIVWLFDLNLQLPDEAQDRYELFVDSVVLQIENELSEQLRLPELIELYYLMVSLRPEYLPYSLQLVNWLIEVQELDQAEEQLQRARNDVQFAQQVAQLENMIQTRRDVQANATQGIPLTRVGKHYLAEVTFDDGYSSRLLIDTGASMTVIKSSVAENLPGLSGSSESVTMKTANGEIQGEKINVSNMKIGVLDFQDIKLGVIPLENFEYDGLLGMDVLGQYQFFIDSQTNTLYLR